MRAVVDTNVWISALINPYGQPAGVLDALRQNHFDLVASRSLLVELAVVLQRPRLVRRFSVTPEKTAALLEILGRRAEIVEIAGVVNICRDPRDDMVVETALAGHVEALVSRDDDIEGAPELIAILSQRGVSVLSVLHFLDKIRASAPPA